jgi:hypothetical protein
MIGVGRQHCFHLRLCHLGTLSGREPL